jgi:alanyl-tRNA synthetase
MDMRGGEIRKAFLDFFEKRGHLILPSSSLVPEGDPTLLFTSAGMVQFKPMFRGEVELKFRRVATAQKCFRTPDIEMVGRMVRYNTFFEMLGNFSFGDYFKEEAIRWAWEFVTQVLGIDKGRIWATIHPEDEEALAIWRDEIGLPESRIVAVEKNYWTLGVGPSGPCSEIQIDLGEEFWCGDPNCIPEHSDSCNRYLELWNLVFTQFDQAEDGTRKPLKQKNIDTGMGLERAAMVVQGVGNVYETDLIRPIIDAAADMLGVSYGKDEETDISLRIISDHIRAVTFIISDGVLPSNEGRGYVLRRVLRRAMRRGALLGVDEPFLYRLVRTVVDIMSEGYPELLEREGHVVKVVMAEEERFLRTREAGMELLSSLMEELRREGKGVIPGEDAFKLYDTYGFPIELTVEMAKEEGFSVDEEGFRAAMEEQRRRGKESWVGLKVDDLTPYRRVEADIGPTEFVGYEELSTSSEIMAILKKDGESIAMVEVAWEGEEVEVFLDRTPFYGEAGGQVGDRGRISSESGDVEVHEARRPVEGLIAHKGKVVRGHISVGDRVRAEVDEDSRISTARHHTSTHLLHAALRRVLGDHVRQAGSLVAPDRLRFDFTHFQPMTEEEIRKVEEMVNEAILGNHPVETTIMGIEEAKRAGAIALFGERYGERVRVVKIGDISMELCGGTHVRATGDIGVFRIVSESGIAAGVRRIEALSGIEALKWMKKHEEILDRIANVLKVRREDVLERVMKIQEEKKELEREAEGMRSRLISLEVEGIALRANRIGPARFVAAKVEAKRMEELRVMAERIRDRLGDGVVLLGSVIDGKAAFVGAVSKGLTGKISASDLVKEMARICGGGGGGRPDLAQAGGRDPEKLDMALSFAEKMVRRILGKEGKEDG